MRCLKTLGFLMKPNRRSTTLLSVPERRAKKPRRAGSLYVEAVEKPLREFDECHADSSAFQNALYRPISSRGMVERP